MGERKGYPSVLALSRDVMVYERGSIFSNVQKVFDGFKASATVFCKEHRIGQIVVDEDPIPTVSTPFGQSRITIASHGPQHRTTKRGRCGTQGRHFSSPHAQNASGERRLIKLDNAWEIDMKHR